MSLPEASVRDIAALYISKGWEVVPLEPGAKSVDIPNWTKIVFKPEDFEEDSNIGIRSVNGLVDIDCDAPEVVQVAPYFLPKTEAIYGRRGEARHWLYKSTFDKTIVYNDLSISQKKEKTKDEKAGLIEIRVNHQSMAPPSKNAGDSVLWVSEGNPTEVKPAELLRAVRLAATCALAVRYYPPSGSRHNWGMALAGLLRSLSLTEAETILIFETAAKVVSDPEFKDRIGTVKATFNRADDEPTKGSGGLVELMVNGKEFVLSLQKMWGVASAAFILTGKGDRIIADSQENIQRALTKLDIKLNFDQFSQVALVKYNDYHGPLEDRVRNRMWLDIDRQFHFRPGPEFFDIVIKDIADKNPIHPVREYLKSLEWDKTPRIDTWLMRAAKAADTEYVSRVSSMVLIAAVRRVIKPGCKFDELLVLESGQGLFKSSVLRALCPDPNWFSDDLPLNVDSKQIIERTTGKWIIEAQELSGMRKSQREHLKSLLSRQVDGPVRMAYARLPVSQPRQFIVIGTTNDHHYLQDPTGNRRFWPIRVEKFNLDLVNSERDQLWAEAAFREAAGESIRLPVHLWEHAGKQQERRRTPDAWENEIANNFNLEEEEYQRLTPTQIWMALGVPIVQRDDQKQARISTIMQRFGFRSMTIKDSASGKVVRGWGRGEKPTAQSLLAKEEFGEKE